MKNIYENESIKQGPLMIKYTLPLIVIYLFFIQMSYSQDFKALRQEGKLKRTNEVNSIVLKVIPSGEKVEILSFPVKGNYYVSYQGIKGYLNETYFIGNAYYPITSSSYSIHTNTQMWNDDNLKEHWKRNGREKIEGVYESTGSHTDIQVPCLNGYGETKCYMMWRQYQTKYKLALIKQAEEFHLIFLDGRPKGMQKVGGCTCEGRTSFPPEKINWKLGETKAKLYKTAVPNFYKSDYFMADKSLNSDTYIGFEKEGIFTLNLPDEEYVYLKIFPTTDEILSQNTNKLEKSSGTGYAISSNGYIVTNYHVINGASSIKVRGINENFSKAFNAKVVIEDKQNDLSIIKIEDPNFTTLGVLPSIVANYFIEVGSPIFVLGYPLRATMGDEVKLTNGIISSKTGFQGDATAYQITAPVQPGNSGGPLFDEKGNIIGIINAKHLGAENVSYAIKSSYLLNLISAMLEPPKLQTINILAGKSLPEQVKILRKFTFIIDIIK